MYARSRADHTRITSFLTLTISSLALFAFNNPDYDERQAAQWQATQVSTVSIMNCLGRISIGIIADFTKSRLGLPRSFCAIIVATLFNISQITYFFIEDISNLWKASALLGLAYGGLFGLFPTLVIEWFGLQHFSENWGFVSLSPMLGGNVFSIAFGRNLDSHEDPDPTPSAADTTLLATAATALSTILPSSNSPSTRSLSASVVATDVTRAGIPSPHHCIIGRACYVDSLQMTIAACCVALALGVYASWRDLRKQRRWASRYAAETPAVVIWESEE